MPKLTLTPQESALLARARDYDWSDADLELWNVLKPRLVAHAQSAVPVGRPRKSGERCPCGKMLLTTARKRYHSCSPQLFSENLANLERRTRSNDYELQHEGETI